MHNKNIQKTKYKLTILFTLSLFGIVFILGTIFFTFRYFQAYKIDKRIFDTTVIQHIQDISKRDDILGLLGLDIENERVEDFFNVKNPRGPKLLKPWSFFVVSDSWEVLSKNIKERIDFEDILEIREGKTFLEEGVFMRKEPIVYFLEDATIYFYKKQSYPFSSYISDISIFTFILVVFSGILGFFSYKFVGRTLRPVEQNLMDMKDFIHNAGHELKTPLSVLRGSLQIMGAEKKLDIKLLKWGIREVDRLAWLIDGLVELSETGKSSQKETFPLMIEVARIAWEFKEYASKKSVTIKNSVTGKYTLYANKEDLYVVVSNILKNAIKYNVKGGKVYISFSEGVLTIRDSGVWIAIEEQEKIFERFYQGESVRSGEGFGIGLSLAKKVADANNWQIYLESKQGKGTEFQIVF